MADIIHVFLRASLSIVVLFILAKFTGVKQLSQLTFFDYVVGISIGNIAAEMSTNFSIPLSHSILSMVTYTLITIMISWLTNKSLILRKFLDGKPVILIKDGKILFKNLAKIRFDINNLLCEARINGFFDLSEIEYAIMEINGDISFLPKPDFLPTTKSDLKIKEKSKGLSVNVIIDGKIIYENLDYINKTDKWLKGRLKELKAPDVKEILLCLVNKNMEITFFPYCYEKK